MVCGNWQVLIALENIFRLYDKPFFYWTFLNGHPANEPPPAPSIPPPSDDDYYDDAAEWVAMKRVVVSLADGFSIKDMGHPPPHPEPPPADHHHGL